MRKALQANLTMGGLPTSSRFAAAESRKALQTNLIPRGIFLLLKVRNGFPRCQFGACTANVPAGSRHTHRVTPCESPTGRVQVPPELAVRWHKNKTSAKEEGGGKRSGYAHAHTHLLHSARTRDTSPSSLRTAPLDLAPRSQASYAPVAHRDTPYESPTRSTQALPGLGCPSSPRLTPLARAARWAPPCALRKTRSWTREFPVHCSLGPSMQPASSGRIPRPSATWSPSNGSEASCASWPPPNTGATPRIGRRSPCPTSWPPQSCRPGACPT